MPEKSPDNGQAGVEVTPEMIEAGVEFLWDSGRLASETRGPDEILVRKMYLLMSEARGVSGRKP